MKLAVKYLFILSFFGLISCGKSTTNPNTKDQTYYVVEDVISLLGATLNDVENSSGQNVVSNNKKFSFRKLAFISNCMIADAHQFCIKTPNTNSFELHAKFNHCTVDEDRITVSGEWLNTYVDGGDGSQACNMARKSRLPSEATVFRKTSNFSHTLSDGRTLSTSTDAHTTYSNEKIPNQGVKVYARNSTYLETTIYGIRRIFSTTGGDKIFDHSIVSTAMDAKGKWDLGTRQVDPKTSEDRITVYNNLSSYKAVLSLSAVSWTDPTCCYPTSGTVGILLSGSLTGSESMTFTTDCGQTKYLDRNGNTSQVALNSCE